MDLLYLGRQIFLLPLGSLQAVSLSKHLYSFLTSSFLIRSRLLVQPFILLKSLIYAAFILLSSLLVSTPDFAPVHKCRRCSHGFIEPNVCVFSTFIDKRSIRCATDSLKSRCLVIYFVDRDVTYDFTVMLCTRLF